MDDETAVKIMRDAVELCPDSEWGLAAEHIMDRVAWMMSANLIISLNRSNTALRAKVKELQAHLDRATSDAAYIHGIVGSYMGDGGYDAGVLIRAWIEKFDSKDV